MKWQLFWHTNSLKFPRDFPCPSAFLSSIWYIYARWYTLANCLIDIMEMYSISRLKIGQKLI